MQMFFRIINWLRPANPRIRVASFHTGRCGSTVLGNMARRHPQIDWRGEIFHSWCENRLSAEDRGRIREPLDILRYQLRCCTEKVYGFETKFKHLNEHGLNLTTGEFVDELLNLGVNRFVILKRKNLLRQSISVARGKSTQKWHYKDEEERPVPKTVSLDPHRVFLAGICGPMLERFADYEDKYREFESLLSAKGVVAELLLKLTYEEDIEQDPTSAYRRLCEFCKVEPITFEPDLKRIHDRPLCELLGNFAEIQQVLEGTQYEWMLE